MSDPQSAGTTVVRQAPGNALATGGVVALFGTFGGLAIGVLLTLAIGAAITWGNAGRGSVRSLDDSPTGIGEGRLLEILKAERDAHKRRDAELESRFDALRANVAEWQEYVEKVRCHCRHPGVGATAEASPPRQPESTDRK
ncbi:MAG TPA: hypothetical protein VHB77_11995 [Planctomycetaceae bacterium]|nr:hypothetical protein [Planctomycetaceae bacterium]